MESWDAADSAWEYVLDQTASTWKPVSWRFLMIHLAVTELPNTPTPGRLDILVDMMITS